MPAPVNITRALATNIPTLPFDTTQQVDDGVTCYSVWYKYTASQDGMLALWMYGDLSIYKQQYLVYLGNSATFYMGLLSSPGSQSLNSPIEFPIRAGETYYFNAVTLNSKAVPAILTIHAELFNPSTSIPTETIAINDDAGRVNRGDGTDDTYPLALLSTTTNYRVLKFVPSFPSGETGDCLNDGTSMVGGDDDDAHTLTLFTYDYQFNPLTSLDLTGSANQLQDIRANRALNKFFVLYFDTNNKPRIARLNSNCVIETTTPPITNASSASISMCTSPDGTIAYLVDGANPAGIRRWDLVNNVPMSDLVTVGGTPQFARNMLCLSDGSVVFIERSSINEIFRYSASGNLLNIYTAASLGIDYIGGEDSRLAQSMDALTFWHRNFLNEDANGNDICAFIKINAVNGQVIKRVQHLGYSVGESLSDLKSATPPPPGFFGHSESCTFWVLPVGFGSGNVPVEVGKTTTIAFTNTLVGAASGIYYIHKGKTNDTLYTSIPTPGSPSGTEVRAIPNPFIVQ